jgi:tetratricopeptide (TPR) repeat protein
MTNAEACLRLLLRGLTIVLVVGALGCGGPRQVAKAPVVELDVPAFEAEKVEVDWGALPSRGRLERANVKLTASDGSGLRLVALTTRAVLYGPLAFTEVHLAFANSEPRTREGTFSITLPDGAAVGRFAMRLPAGWQEGEVVERQAARAAFETFLRKKVDPALLERDGGNVFRGRVFPIDPYEIKEIVIAYTETFAGRDTPYRFPLAGLPAVDKLDVQLLVPSRRKVFVLRRAEVAPDRDFVYGERGENIEAVRGGRWAVVRLSSKAPVVAQPASTRSEALAVLIDSSASRASTYQDDVASVGRIVEALAPPSVKVACFDQELVPVASIAEAAKRRPAGASDLGRALAWLATTGAKRAIVVTDGNETLGDHGAGALAAKVRALSAARIERLDVLSTFGANLSNLNELVKAGLARSGLVVDLSAGPEVAVSAFRAPTGAIAKGEVPDATRVWPSTLSSKGATAMSALAFVEIAEDKPLRVSVDGGKVETIDRAEKAPGALVARAVAEARIQELSFERSSPTTTKTRREELAHEIVSLSVEHRVLSELTAMLVLETEADYARFHISRDAMRDIPVVGPHGVEMVPRGGGHDLLSKNGSKAGSSPPVDGNTDSDGDGIPDITDKCPDEPELFNGFQDEDGCPDRGLVTIESSYIIVLRKVKFRRGSAEILEESREAIDAVAFTMLRHREFDVVGIYGHTDVNGDPAANKLLSEKRAIAVRDALIARGVPPNRLIAKGFGGRAPEDPGDKEDAHEKNRRVEFKILVAQGQPTGVEEPPGPAVPPLQAGRSALVWEPIDMQPFRYKAAPAGDPLSGKLASVTALISERKSNEALSVADEWVKTSPNDMLAWIAQGRALEALRRPREAARAYGSILDLAGRVEQRRAAAAFLEAASAEFPPALDIAIEVYEAALRDRPDHPSGHRLYAWSLARAGRIDEALDVLLRALGRTFDNRFVDAHTVLKTDVGLLAAAAMKNQPDSREHIRERALAAGAVIPTTPSTRLVLTWENDEADVDLLAYDAKRRLAIPPADVRSGFGPESLVLDPRTVYPVQIAAQLVTQGPTGFVLGKVAMVRHDGHGGLRIEDRPFVVMNQGAAAPLGDVVPAP